jgi:two-component system cell cycle response regulator DivK
MHVVKRRSPILIVEDHPDTREMYALYLRTRGCCVVEACNGQQARHRARESRPAVIVVDLSLPLPGACELIRTLRMEAPTRGIPIIGLNGFGYQEYSERALRAGCCCALVKPCLPDALAHEIQQTLDIETRSGSGMQPRTVAS